MMFAATSFGSSDYVVGGEVHHKKVREKYCRIRFSSRCISPPTVHDCNSLWNFRSQFCLIMVVCTYTEYEHHISPMIDDKVCTLSLPRIILYHSISPSIILSCMHHSRWLAFVLFTILTSIFVIAIIASVEIVVVIGEG